MENLNENLNTVLDLCSKKLDTDTIYEYLKFGSIVEKQVAILELSEIRSQEEAEILLNNLVGVDGKLRQATAYKILQLMEKYNSFFKNPSFYETFTKAIVDIDSNVCRLVIDSVRFLADDRAFSLYLVNAIKNIIFDSFEELSKLSFRTKKYTSNKQYFKIYWALEALFYFYEVMDLNILKDILIKCSKLPEYTIREKCALILKNDFSDNDLLALKSVLKQDENYYVRNV